MERAENKALRLQQIEQLLWAHPEGLSQSEVARRSGVNRSTIWKYVENNQLPPGVYVDEFDDNKLKLDRSADLTKAAFNLHEIMALHLATRLLATRTDKQNPHAAAALRKLAKALQRLDQNVSQHLLRSADVMDEAAAYRDPVFLQVLETLTEAWSAGRKVKVMHQHEDGRIHEYVFAPYFIEPYAVGQTTHVIGWREPPRAIRTFKVERLRSAQMLPERYAVPADFDPAALLRNAWGIWTTDAEPVEVVLRFHPRVARRVQETQWQRGQQVEVQADGWLLWRALIAEPQEMLPWIRGWGADVEVVGPENLRNALTQTAEALGQHYGLISGTVTRLPHQIPYAKTNPNDPESIHLLIYHLIDVGQVTLALWNDVLTDGVRKRLADLVSLRIDECGRFLAFLAALHDLGKAGPAYQQKYAPGWLTTELENAGLSLKGMGRAYRPELPHGTVTTWVLDVLLPEMLGLEKRFAYKLAVAVGGHHGIWPKEKEIDNISDGKHPEWGQIRRDLVSELIAVFNPPTNATPPAATTETNVFLTILSGLTSVADWVGSQNDRFFGYQQQPLTTRRYAELAGAKARTSLEHLGWIGWRPNGETKTFAEAFSYLGFGELRPVQQAVIECAMTQASPTMFIIEAPTGIGKTELALYIADQWLQREAGRGLYVAMPTQATSNQMFTRVGEFLHRRYPDMPINYHLVHGQAAWLDELKQQVELQGVGDDGQAHLIAENWFGPRKRTLLAPFGVGTVDQTLLSVLQTKHFFVRLFGLSHKVVIFDEVHAYDTYMNTIFHLLLSWLNAIGTSVIILSATLPASTRQALVKAYAGKELSVTELVYPALTIANTERCQTMALPKPESYPLEIDRNVERAPDAIVQFLRGELVKGGYAAVICNTVGRAQEVYRALDTARQRGDILIDEANLILFHGAFPPVWRKEIEQTVLQKFGKGGERQGSAIVVATQVIEQSLDIDFDLMITDLAPIDLLLQRAGRLHRHAVNDMHRHGLPRRLVITKPALCDNGAPNFDVETNIYDEYTLFRTYLVLQGRDRISIPDDMTGLIEAVYDSDYSMTLPSGIDQDSMQVLLQQLQNSERSIQAKAGQGLIHAPCERRLLDQAFLELEEDDPRSHETLRAKTRDIDFSITVVCIHQNSEGLFIFGEKGQRIWVDLNREPSKDLVKVLLQNSVAIQNPSVGKHFVEQALPQSWQRNAALRYVRYATFKEGRCELPKHNLKLSRNYGLETIKKEKA